MEKEVDQIQHWSQIQQLDFIADFKSEELENYKKNMEIFKSNDYLENLQKEQHKKIKESFSDEIYSQLKKAQIRIIDTWILNETNNILPDDCIQLTQFNFWLSQNQFLDPVISLKFVEDLFDILAIKEIRQLFEIAEPKILEIQQQYGNIDHVKHGMLKLCNILFKKMSRSMDVDIRGRLHLFLTKVLPLCHPSGRNNYQEINPNNPTIIQDMTQEEINSIFEEYEGKKIENQQNLSENKKQKQNFNLNLIYSRFWALQKYFHKNDNIFNNEADEDLYFLRNYEEQKQNKIDEQKKKEQEESQKIQEEMDQIMKDEDEEKEKDGKNKNNDKNDKEKKKIQEKQKEKEQEKLKQQEKEKQQQIKEKYNSINKLQEICNVINEVIQYFNNFTINESGNTVNLRYPKFLTLQSLIEIQFKDTFFRKIILVQCILFFDNLQRSAHLLKLKSSQSSNNSKNQNQSEQKFQQLQKLINETSEKVTECLKKICKNLKENSYVEQIQHFLAQENIWMDWKKQWKQVKPPTDTFFKSPPQSQIPKAINQYESTINLNSEQLRRKKIETDIYNVPINDFSKSSHDLKRQQLLILKKNVKDLTETDSNIKKILNQDNQYRYNISTDPQEPTPACFLNQVYKEQVTQKYGEDGPLKKQEKFVWKAMRNLSKFDILLLKPLDQEKSLQDIEQVCHNVQTPIQQRLQQLNEKSKKKQINDKRKRSKSQNKENEKDQVPIKKEEDQTQEQEKIEKKVKSNNEQ